MARHASGQFRSLLTSGLRSRCVDTAISNTDANPADGRLEGIDTTLLCGFKDDMVVRIQEVLQGTRVDVRSKSRVGRSDLGVNAGRIRTFLTQLRSALPAA